jgi:predicted HTH transcriptional regulator
MRRTNYVGLDKTHLQHVATAAAVDLIRVGEWLEGTPLAKTRQSHFAKLKKVAAWGCAGEFATSVYLHFTPIRRGTHTVPLEAVEIESFLHRRGSLSWEKRPVELATLDDLDFTLVEEFNAHRQSNRSKTGGRNTDFETLLLKSNCATYDTGATSMLPQIDEGLTETKTSQAALRPTNAGLLLFGKAPHEFIMQAELVCVLYADNLGLKRYIDRRNLHGTIAQQIDQAEEFLRKHIR